MYGGCSEMESKIYFVEKEMEIASGNFIRPNQEENATTVIGSPMLWLPACTRAKIRYYKDVPVDVFP
jgi:hypothetical protein